MPRIISESVPRNRAFSFSKASSGSKRISGKPSATILSLVNGKAWLIVKGVPNGQVHHKVSDVDAEGTAIPKIFRNIPFPFPDNKIQIMNSRQPEIADQVFGQDRRFIFHARDGHDLLAVWQFTQPAGCSCSRD